MYYFGHNYILANFALYCNGINYCDFFIIEMPALCLVLSLM